jgi:hypothetical protein
MTELKPCPVCNSANVGVRSWWNSLHETGYFAECMDCGCMVGFMADPMGWCAAVYDTEAEAAEAWNTRAERTCKLAYGEDDDGVDGWYTQCGGWFAATRKDGRMVHPKFCQLCGGKAVKR